MILIYANIISIKIKKELLTHEQLEVLPILVLRTQAMNRNKPISNKLKRKNQSLLNRDIID